MPSNIEIEGLQQKFAVHGVQENKVHCRKVLLSYLCFLWDTWP